MSVISLTQRLTHPAPVSVAAIMTLSLACFHAGALPLPLRFAGLALFALLTLIQPVGGLVCVVLAAPLYLMPTSVDAAGRTWLFPLHEIALLVTTAGVAGRWALQRMQRRSLPDLQALAPHTRIAGITYAPHVLLALAGIIGVALAVPEGRGAALRELRWLIVEPLLFYGLVHVTRMSHLLLAGALALSGGWVATIGILQFAGLDLAPLIGEKRAFSENIIVVDGVRRVTSVYGHPNNLGLFLERVGPLAAALALGLRSERRSALFFAICAFLSLAGVAVSFSRGAWLASAVAAAVVGADWFLFRSQDRRFMRWSALALTGVVIAAVAGLALTLRGGPGGGSTDARLLLWRESLAYLQQHPFGLGLDQFYYYHNPAFGRSRIDPSLIGTSEEYAAHPHNLLLDAWINVGPIGVLALGWLLLRFYRNAFSAVRERSDLLALGALAAMTAALVHGLVDRFYFVPDLAIAFWGLIAVVNLSVRCANLVKQYT
ncbi:MAG: O-antigen ligase family protein [Roseiflexaceae bacterium]|nr:O-antigen ligase family protein [Roseiflexus sp.]MDW8212891.1 O-antigen ligase family protein [Roseiflexaceae bacterium]